MPGWIYYDERSRIIIMGRFWGKIPGGHWALVDANEPELAAWTTVANVLFNLDETMTKEWAHDRLQRLQSTPNPPPFLQPRPNIGQRPESCATANEDRDLALHCVGVVGRLAHVFDVFEIALQCFSGIVEHDQTIPRVSARPPQKIGLMTAEGWRQPVATSQEVDGARLPVVLRQDAAARPFFGR